MGDRCVFGWLRRKHTEKAKRPEIVVFRFDKIDPIKPSPKFWTTGPHGWGFTLWGSPDGEEFMYRHLLETFAAQNPDARLELPEWSDGEDLIEGELIWRSHHVSVWYETALSHIWLWSAERDVIDSLRSAISPVAKPS